MSKEVHKAIVSRVDDPATLGRIRVVCQTLAGANKELPAWIAPKLPFSSSDSVGWFGVPDPGSEVDIEVSISESIDETYGEASLRNPDYRWLPGEYSSSNPVDEDLATNYPRRRGYAFKAGAFFFDETEGAESVTLKWRPPGEANPITITLSKNSIVIDGPEAHLEMSVKTANLISGEQAMVRGDDLVTWLAGFITTGFNLHIHSGVTTGPGVSGPPVTPLSPPSAPDFLSTKGKLE